MKFGSLVLRLILSTTSTFGVELMLPCRGFRPACLVQTSEPPFVSRLTTGRDYIGLTNTIQAKNEKYLKYFSPCGRISISKQICDPIVVMLPAQPWSSSAWPCHPPVSLAYRFVFFKHSCYDSMLNAFAFVLVSFAFSL